MKAFMKREFFGLKLWWFLIPLAVALVLFLIGTFADLQISKAIVDQSSPLGIFFEGWGMVIPFAVGAVASAAVAAGVCQVDKTAAKVGGFLLAAAGIGMMIFQTATYIKKYFSGGAWVHEMGVKGTIIVYAIASILMFGAAIPSFFLFLKRDKETLIRLGIIIIVFIALQAGILEVFKRLVMRPRFRYIAGYMFDSEGNKVYAEAGDIEMYRAWFSQWQWFKKSNYPNIVDSDAIKSFPSGHTGMCYSVMFVPMLLPLYGLSEEKKKLWMPLSFGVAGLYLTLLAFFRVQVGAHWLSDVSGAVIVCTAVVFLVYVCNNLVLYVPKEKRL